MRAKPVSNPSLFQPHSRSALTFELAGFSLYIGDFGAPSRIFPEDNFSYEACMLEKDVASSTHPEALM
jgi:hypothetical protein